MLSKIVREWSKAAPVLLAAAMAVSMLVPVAVFAAPEEAAPGEVVQAEDIPLINELERSAYSTSLSNENAYSGLYRQTVSVGGKDRELAVYLPEGMRRDEYVVTIALPNGEDAYQYLQNSGWMEISEATRTVVRVLIPADNEWGSYEEESSYISAARGAGGNSFTGAWYMTTGFDYIYGVGEGGAVLEQWAALNPMNVISQVYVNVDLTSEALSALTEDLVYTDNMAMPAHADSKVSSAYTEVRADDIPIPTWLINSDASADYWKSVNDCAEESEEISDGTKFFYQDKTNSNAIATSFTDVVSSVIITENLPYDELDALSYTFTFLTFYTRSTNDSVHANALLERLDYSEAAEEGRLFEVFDFIQTVDNSGNESATTATTDWKRNYIVYVPEACKNYADVQYPVVYFFSGGSTPSHAYLDQTNAWQIADKYGFIAVIPSSVNGWNLQDGSWPPTVDSATGSISDDMDFVDKLFTQIEKDFNIDTGRVYITGLSMGGIFTNYIGMQLGDRVTAVGGTSGPIFDAEIYNENYSKGSGYQYLEGTTTNILPAMYIFGERDNWPIKIGEYTDEDYDLWYAGQMNTNNANRFNDLYYSYATQKYWVDRNGLDFDDYVYTEKGLTADGQVLEAVEYNPETAQQRYTTAMWYNDQDIPLFSWVACAGRAHSTLIEDYEKVWTDWFAHFTMDEDGTRYYDGKAIGAEEPLDIEKFVTRLYKNFLQRDPDEKGIADWVRVLEDGSATGAQVVRGFVFSPEFSSKEMSDEEYVTAFYRIIFDREPDEAGLASWLDAIARGASREKVLSGFVNSREMGDLCERLGIQRGHYIVEPVYENIRVTAFVARLYRICLGREPEESGLTAWVSALNSKAASGTKVARSFFKSKEFAAKELSDEEFLHIAYRTLLDREADADGFAGWLKALEEGYSRNDVLKGFLGSKEFGNLCDSYGIERVNEADAAAA